MKRITQTKEIQSGDNSGIVVSGDEKISLTGTFTADDFLDNDLITKVAVIGVIVDMSTPTPSDETFIIV